MPSCFACSYLTKKTKRLLAVYMCVGWDRPWIYLTSVVLSAAGHADLLKSRALTNIISIRILSFCIWKGISKTMKVSGGSRGGAGPGPAPLIFRPNWGPKSRKKFLETPLLLSQGLDDRPTLSEGLDPPLKVICSKKNNSQHYIKEWKNIWTKAKQTILEQRPWDIYFWNFFRPLTYLHLLLANDSRIPIFW